MLSVPTLLGVGAKDNIYTDVVLINKGGRDATVVFLMLGVGPKASPMPHWKGAWSCETTEVVPARKTVTRRFHLGEGFVDSLREDYGTPAAHDIQLICRLLDADGNPHMVEHSLGTLALTDTD